MSCSSSAWARIREIEGLGYRAYGKRYDFTHTIPQILAEYSSEDRRRAFPGIQSPHRRPREDHPQQGQGRASRTWRRTASSSRSTYAGTPSAPNDFTLFQLLDIGDLIGAEGYLFRTRTGELSVHVERLEFLSKTLLSMPEKWHGLEDVEMRYRQRYLDLIANPESRKVFVTRAKIISSCGGSWRSAASSRSRRR